MSHDEIIKRLGTILTEKMKKEIDMDKVTNDSMLQEDIGIDSLEVVELLYEIEQEFNVSISDDEATGLKNVNDVVENIKSKLN